MRIGELSRELKKAEAHGGKICLPADGKSKSKQLADAGISTSSRPTLRRTNSAVKKSKRRM
jgi:hypothetical protein